MSDRQLDDVLAEARKRFLSDKPVKKPCRIEQESAAAEPWWESRGYASLQEALDVMLPKIRRQSAAVTVVVRAGTPDRFGEVHGFDIHADAVHLLPRKCDWCEGSGEVGKKAPCSICGGSGRIDPPAETPQHHERDAT